MKQQWTLFLQPILQRLPAWVARPAEQRWSYNLPSLVHESQRLLNETATNRSAMLMRKRKARIPTIALGIKSGPDEFGRRNNWRNSTCPVRYRRVF